MRQLSKLDAEFGDGTDGTITMNSSNNSAGSVGSRVSNKMHPAALKKWGLTSRKVEEKSYPPTLSQITAKVPAVEISLTCQRYQ
jgi:hypothetical protein